MSDRSRLGELAHALGEWAPGDPPALSWLLPEVRAILHAELMGAYRPARGDAGWSLDFMQLVGDSAPAKVQAFESYVSRLPAGESFLDYRPHAVPLAERNRVLSVGELARVRGARLAELPHETLFRALEIVGHDQIRVLVCSGPNLLAWVGATRAKPFSKREAELLGLLGEPLRDRLALERRLRTPELRAAALDAALEAIGRPAFVIGPRGAVELANTAGLAMLENDRTGVLESIRASGAGGSREGAFSITRIAMPPGCPSYRLAVEKEGTFALAERLGVATRRWSLTARQVRVLELVTSGVTNKEIARQSQCAEVTVERHVTELLQRSGARSRADLVGRLFRLPTR